LERLEQDEAPGADGLGGEARGVPERLRDRAEALRRHSTAEPTLRVKAL